jgi:hypothetical protein
MGRGREHSCLYKFFKIKRFISTTLIYWGKRLRI